MPKNESSGKKEAVIAHDVGTSSSKAVLISTEGEILSSAEMPYDFHYPHPGWVEQDPEDYWQAIVASSRKIMQSKEADGCRLVGVVFATQAMGIIPVDKAGNVLRKNITWVDGRAEEEARRMMNIFLGRRAFKSLVGIEITGKDVIPKLLWLKKKEKDIYSKAHRILDVNGYLKYRATGEMVAEWSGACSYAFNLKKKDWERIFFKLVGIDLDKLPRLVRSVDVVGGLTDQAAREMGLEPGVPVFGGCDDTQSAAVGTGAVGEGEAHIYLGTSAWVGVSTSRAPKFKNGAVCLQSADPTKNLIVGITESAGANLEWFIERFYHKEKEHLGVQGIYDLLDQEASEVSAGSDHLIITPWLLGERCPVSTTTTRGTVFNLSLEHKRGHFVRALAEGIAFNLRWIIENYEKDFGLKISELKITGGGSTNQHWMQIFADVTRRVIHTTNQPKMAGAIGAAMCAFVGAGVFKGFDAVKNMISVSASYIPREEHGEIYGQLFERYKDLYGSLKKVYIKANHQRFNQ
jgi:xylulokinase